MYQKYKHNEIIENSHKRCIEQGLTRDFIDKDVPISEEELKIKIEKNKDFIKLATPFIDKIYEFLNDTGYYIMLSDNEGCILYINGDDKDLIDAKNNHIELGMYKDEKTAGTNGIGTSLVENLPIQINGEEHFLKYQNLWTCSGAPIHDQDGNTIGCLNLTGKAEKIHNHTLGLVVAAVSSIENEIKVKRAHDELYSAYCQINKLINSMNSGIISVDAKGYIKNVNSKSCEILNQSFEEIKNKKAADLIDNWEYIMEEYRKLSGDIHIEIYFKNKNDKRYNAEIYAIENQEGNIHEYIVTIYEINKLYKLVSKYSGFEAKYSFNDIITNSESVINLKKEAEKVSHNQSTVLIQGESGTGKELFAQAIHNASNRRNNPFIEVNCAAIPKSLIESELFGYEDGAFTGARKKGCPGKFELANGGTIFLDEIGEMPMDMQVKLLRVLQDRTVMRVGGTRKIPIDIRVIAATNRELEEEIKSNNFREDLYYRLNVFPINIPALRERIEDIEPLTNHFIKKFSNSFNKTIDRVDTDVIKVLQANFWHGNIRELENVIERIINVIENTTITYKSLPKYLLENYEKLYDSIDRNKDKDKDNKLIDAEIREITKIIKNNNGNLKESAKLLGIGRSTLYRKLKKYDIDCKIYRE